MTNDVIIKFKTMTPDTPPELIKLIKAETNELKYLDAGQMLYDFVGLFVNNFCYSFQSLCQGDINHMEFKNQINCENDKIHKFTRGKRPAILTPFTYDEIIDYSIDDWHFVTSDFFNNAQKVLSLIYQYYRKNSLTIPNTWHESYILLLSRVVDYDKPDCIRSSANVFLNDLLVLSIIGTIDIEIRSLISKLELSLNNDIKNDESKTDNVPNPNHTECVSRFFKDKASQFIFALNHTANSEIIEELLELDDTVYSSIQSATEWYARIMHQISSVDDESYEAQIALYDYYRNIMSSIIKKNN